MKKSLIKILIRELHNDLIKPPSEDSFCGTISESGEVIIRDTSFFFLLFLTGLCVPKACA